ncbi:MAG TPA: hypothetical protein VMU26_04870 [Candidatus Polarisedimenticolia bacterium]|nr:hypothetical protein [Candidatus Polarisedimenticolia bacterium]
MATCARLCHDCSGELEQIRFLLGHASIQTTERYIGSKQKLQDAVNDRFEISVARAPGEPVADFPPQPLYALNPPDSNRQFWRQPAAFRGLVSQFPNR